MRQGANNPRRSRGRNNNRKQHIPLRHQTFDSNGPDVRVRGNAYQVFEKYMALARDATASGDRINAESYYQHAEHYYRIINSENSSQPNGAGRGGNGNGNNRPAGPADDQVNDDDDDNDNSDNDEAPSQAAAASG